MAEDELGSANGRMGGTDALARAAGPAFAGYLVQLVGAVWASLSKPARSCWRGLSTATIRPRPPAPGRSGRRPRLSHLSQWGREIVDGFACVYRITPLRWLTVNEAAYLFFFDVCFAIVVVFFRADLGLGPATIGVIFSADSLGGVLGATVTNSLRARAGFDATVKAAAVLRGLGLAILPLGLVAPGYAVVAVLVAGRGINTCAWSVDEVVTETYQQTTLPTAGAAAPQRRSSGRAMAPPHSEPPLRQRSLRPSRPASSLPRRVSAQLEQVSSASLSRHAPMRHRGPPASPSSTASPTVSGQLPSVGTRRPVEWIS